MITRSPLARLTAALAAGVLVLAAIDGAAYARGGGAGSGGGGGPHAYAVTTTGNKAPGGNINTQGGSSCKGPACNIKAPTTGVSTTAHRCYPGGHGGGSGWCYN